jgi:diguanylate cyclase (GGDEF)-like protein
MGLDTTAVLLGIVAAAGVLAVFWMARRRARRARTLAHATMAAFTQQLFAAQTTADTRAVIARDLADLLGTSRYWISSYAGGRRQLIVPQGDDDRANAAWLSEPFQEWTTLPLRAGEVLVGLLGVDSASARRPEVRGRMDAVAPLIGQALQNAHAVDVLREASLMDALTGTATRREGLARLHAELKRAQRTGTSMAVLLLDLDRFKSINDRWGHAMGDAVLMAVGQTLRRTLRASDIRCRWGGEEFLVALPDADLARARVVATGLLKNIASATVATAHGPVGTTASIGLTMTGRAEMNLEAIIHRADVALYRAKNDGRANVRVVSPDGVLEHAPDPGVSSFVDQERGRAAGTGADDSDADAAVTEKTLPFPDRRKPGRPDRRQMPGPGRRVTDPV